MRAVSFCEAVRNHSVQKLGSLEPYPILTRMNVDPLAPVGVKVYRAIGMDGETVKTVVEKAEEFNGEVELSATTGGIYVTFNA